MRCPIDGRQLVIVTRTDHQTHLKEQIAYCTDHRGIISHEFSYQEEVTYDTDVDGGRGEPSWAKFSFELVNL